MRCQAGLAHGGFPGHCPAANMPPEPPVVESYSLPPELATLLADFAPRTRPDLRPLARAAGVADRQLRPFGTHSFLIFASTAARYSAPESAACDRSGTRMDCLRADYSRYPDDTARPPRRITNSPEPRFAARHPPVGPARSSDPADSSKPFGPPPLAPGPDQR